MTRHELKDGKWYLVKVKDRYLTLLFEQGDFINTNKSLFGKSTVEHLIEDEAEWARINPEEIFDDTLRIKYE